MDLLKRITELRDERGWSINYLAKTSDLPQSTVSNLYNRTSEPSVTTLERICTGFGISLAEFFSDGEEGTMLSDEQKRLLLEWSKLTQEQKQSVLSVMSEM